MKPKMSRARAMAYAAILKKGHAHKNKKDFDRKKLKKELAKEIDSL